MFEAVGYRVKRLVRIRIGPVRLGDLPQGHWRALTKRELQSLEEQAVHDETRRL
jgi:23S rRNA pseudouridine2605 synthase